MIKVCKFGGSSVAKEEGYRRVKEIVSEDEERKIVVVSAPGKRFPEDEKITDLLYEAFSKREDVRSYSDAVKKIKDRFFSLCDFAGAKEEKEEVERFFSNGDNARNENLFISRGEYFSAKILAKYLGADFVDAKDCLIFDYNGKFNFLETTLRCKNAINPNVVTVIPGFYGGYSGGQICLFGRGGSDYSGACISAAVRAAEYENFTDVDGVFNADPKTVERAEVIPFLTFSELSSFSSLGANVLEEHTLEPLTYYNVPLSVKNTFGERSRGTKIEKDRLSFSGKPLGIVEKRGLIVFFAKKSKDADGVKTLRGISSFLAGKAIAAEEIVQDKKRVSVIVNESELNKFSDRLPGEKTKLSRDTDVNEKANLVCGRLSCLYGVESAEFCKACLVSIIGEERKNRPRNGANTCSSFFSGALEFASSVSEAFYKNGTEIVSAIYSAEDNVMRFVVKGDAGTAVKTAYSVVFG